MNLELFKELVQPLVIISCLIMGYVLKHYIPLENKHIPLILLVSGIIFSFLITGYIDFVTTLIGGGLSGLASTGFHQMFAQYLEKPKDDDFNYIDLKEEK